MKKRSLFKQAAFSAAAMMLGSSIMITTVSGDERIQTFNTGEQIIVSIDGISGEYTDTYSNVSQDTYEGSGSLGTDGTVSQADGQLQSFADLLGSLSNDNTGLDQKKIVWDNFEQVIADLEQSGITTQYEQSSDLLNIVIEGTIQRPRASSINDAVEEYKNLLKKQPSDLQADFDAYRESLDNAKEGMESYIDDLYRQISDAYNRWREDHSSVPELSLTDNGFEYSLTIPDTEQGDVTITLPFTTMKFYDIEHIHEIPDYSGNSEYAAETGRDLYPRGDPRYPLVFCGYDVQKSLSGIYYIEDIEGDIYILTDDDLYDIEHAWYEGDEDFGKTYFITLTEEDLSNPDLFNSDYFEEPFFVWAYDTSKLTPGTRIAVNQQEWWEYEKTCHRESTEFPTKQVITYETGWTLEDHTLEEVIEHNSDLLKSPDELAAELGDTIFNPELPTDITPEDIQIEDARILEDLYRLLEETMADKNDISLDLSVNPRYDSIEQWMEEQGDHFTDGQIKNLTPEQIREYLEQGQGLDLDEARDLMRKTFEENTKRYKLPEKSFKPSTGQDSAEGSDWLSRFSNFDAYASSSMDDTCEVILYEQYQLNDVRYTAANRTDYNSNLRRWHIYLNGIEMAIPITDNPRHALAITANEPGEYVLTADQWVEQSQAESVEYTVQKALVEKSTGRLLYQVVKKGKSNNGSIMFQLDNGTGHWEPTGEYLTLIVNDLGNIVDRDQESKVHRVY